MCKSEYLAGLHNARVHLQALWWSKDQNLFGSSGSAPLRIHQDSSEYEGVQNK